MTTLFHSGVIVDVILMAIIAEAIVLIAYRSRTGRGILPLDLLVNLLAGAFLLMALRSALIGLPWKWTAAWLAAALVAHVVDLRQRWRR
ncbi:MAG TPA: hypothetical protein VEK55_05840 [Xanthobacteraceae bacterium]|nr:hypothetical protein [Xanthobacteraceae bacterium]